MLVEGSSMRSVSRVLGISINTVTKLIGFSNYVSRSRVADMIGKRQHEPNRETWRRLSEMYLWSVAGYPLQNLASADFRTREATWDSLYMAPQARKGIKGLTLPRDPFEFVALYPVCP